MIPRPIQGNYLKCLLQDVLYVFERPKGENMEPMTSRAMFALIDDEKSLNSNDVSTKCSKSEPLSPEIAVVLDPSSRTKFSVEISYV
uniref:Uncharacterized protein n=1 Tax=Romanomermis culicivorax TaxID=13658 RepID=A0A915JNR4_ROMCU